jgi:hypothetical protein
MKLFSAFLFFLHIPVLKSPSWGLAVNTQKIFKLNHGQMCEGKMGTEVPISLHVLCVN